MFRLLANSIILVTALALAGFGYKHFIDRHSDEDRYNIFDLLEGTPVSPAVADGKIKDAILGQAEIPKVVAKPISKGESDLDLNGTELLERVNRSLSDLTSSVVPSVARLDAPLGVKPGGEVHAEAHKTAAAARRLGKAASRRGAAESRSSRSA